MVEKSDVAAVLELIRPSLQADGGDVQLVDVSDDGVVTVELQGLQGLPHVPDDARQWRRAHPEGARARRDVGCAGDVICSVRPDGHTDHSTLRGSDAFHIHPCFARGVGRSQLGAKAGESETRQSLSLTLPIKRLFVEMRGRCMEGCWSRRGCDDEMQGRCPHNVPGEPCPADCHYAACHRPTHVVCEDFGVLLNPNRDYDAAVKQVCRFCEHFLVNGPDIDPETRTRDKFSGRNRFLL